MYLIANSNTTNKWLIKIVFQKNWTNFLRKRKHRRNLKIHQIHFKTKIVSFIKKWNLYKIKIKNARKYSKQKQWRIKFNFKVIKFKIKITITIKIIT